MIPTLLLAALAAAAGCRDLPEMLRIDAGPFWAGSDAGERALADRLSSPAVREARWFDAELPRQRATLPTFCIDRLLVTQARILIGFRCAGSAGDAAAPGPVR